MFLITVSKLILLKEKIQGPLVYSSRSKTTDENVHQKMAWWLASTFLVWRSSFDGMDCRPSAALHREWILCPLWCYYAPFEDEGSWNPIISCSVATCQHACCIPVHLCTRVQPRLYVSSSLESHMHWIALQHSEIVRHMMWQSRQIKSFTAGWAGIAHSVVGENSVGSSITSMIHI